MQKTVGDSNSEPPRDIGYGVLGVGSLAEITTGENGVAEEG